MGIHSLECTKSPCFQDILNADTTFSKRCYMLNYGVGGYGVDQTYLLMSSSVAQYRNPVIVFSLLTEDLDRALLSVREGPKPRYVLDDGKLESRMIPIDRDPADSFARTNPAIRSYLWRLALRNRWMPDRFKQSCD